MLAASNRSAARSAAGTRFHDSKATAAVSIASVACSSDADPTVATSSLERAGLYEEIRAAVSRSVPLITIG